MVILTNGQGGTTTNAQVGIETTMLDMEMGSQSVSLEPVTGGTQGWYRGQGELLMAGHWQLTVRVQLANQGQTIRAAFLLTAA